MTFFDNNYELGTNGDGRWYILQNILELSEM